MSDSDALQRLKNKNRPVVESRDASVTPVSSVSPDTSIPRYPGKQMSRIPNSEVSPNPDNENTGNGDTEASSNSSNTEQGKKQKELPLQPQTLETRQSTLLLEAGVSDRLQTCVGSRGFVGRC